MEDQALDSERSHTSEQHAAIVFEDSGFWSDSLIVPTEVQSNFENDDIVATNYSQVDSLTVDIDFENSRKDHHNANFFKARTNLPALGYELLSLFDFKIRLCKI